MYTDDELAEAVAALQDPDPAERASMLKALWAWPAGDPRLWPHVEALLDDGEPCLFGTPPRVGEMRWLAAHVLAADYKQDDSQKRRVQLADVVQPVGLPELQTLAAQVGLDEPTSRAEALETFRRLQKADELPRIDLEL